MPASPRDRVGSRQKPAGAQWPLGLLLSRVVAYVDDLEDRGYIERRATLMTDASMPYLSASGKKLMGKIGDLARQHDAALPRDSMTANARHCAGARRAGQNARV